MNKKGHVLNGILLAMGLAVIRNPLQTQQFTTDAQLILVDLIRLLPPITLGAMLPDIDTAFGKHRKTLHNLPVVAGFVAFPPLFGNLTFVWIGIATHYVLDVLGSKRGIALFYPLSSTEYGLPIGVKTSSKWADLMTVSITGFEIVVLALFGLVIVPNVDVQLQALEQVIAGLQ
jgi:membrane-bound metal-dependent hydrolase YbcI (DUF457 family)